MAGFLFCILIHIGVCSVATTSTKSPNAIQADIRRVLERMQVQYRETKTGFECIHMPSIDISSLQPAISSHHQKRPSTGSHEDKHRTLTKKASKRSFGMRGKDKEREKEKDKELPSRPSGGTTLSTTASSASSSFFHVSSNAHTATVEAARSGTLENLAAPGPEESPRPQSPSKGKTLPPIPHDLVPASPQAMPASPLPTVPDIFESMGASSLAVRFEINVVKVRYCCDPIAAVRPWIY